MRKNGGMLAGWIPSVTGFSLALLMLGGCAQIGPASISHGRGAYNEVIAKTDDDQSLAFIVRLRYGETANLLTVISLEFPSRGLLRWHVKFYSAACRF